MKHLIFCSFLFSFLGIYAQQCFEAVKTIGCAPFTVQIKNCGSAKNPIYVFEGEADDLTKATKDTFYTYTKAGYYDIHQLVGTTTIESFTKAQYIRVVDNPLPNFEVFACEGKKVTVTIPEEYYDEYLVDFGDGSTAVSLKGLESYTHTYTDTILKTISVRGNYTEVDCFNNATKTILPIEELKAPTLSFSKNNNNNQFTSTLTGFYRLNYLGEKEANSTFQVVDSFKINNSINHSIDFDNSICIRYKNYDLCGNEDIGNKICSFSGSGEALNNQNIIKWNSYPLPTQLTEYQVFRNDELLLSTQDTILTDTNLQCGIEYCYEIRAILTSNNYSASNSICLTAFSTDTPPTIKNLNASYDKENIVLTWDTLITAKTVFIRRTSKNTTDDFITSDKHTYSDQNIEDSTVYCYELYYEDVCENVLPIKTSTCPSLLSYQQSFDGNILKWTTYKGGEVNQYTLHWLDTEKNIIKSIILSKTDTTYIDGENTQSQQFYYQLEINISQGTSFSNLVFAEQSSKVFLPTAFSPNGNGENEIFHPLGSFIIEYSLMIYNQQGKMIYEGKNQGWDGKYNGKLVPIGVYAYFAEILDEKGQKIIKQGTITLVP